MRVAGLGRGVVGERLGQTVYDGRGRVLLRAGILLTAGFVEQLRQRGFSSVPVADSTEGPETLRRETCQAALSVARRAFRPLVAQSGGLAASARRVVEELIAEISVDPGVVHSLTALRSLDEGVFAHAVNVCVYSLLLGVSQALDRAELQPLGVGALLHDVGKVFYQDLVNKPGPLSPEEYTTIQDHAVRGFELLRRHPGIHLLSAHVAYQHHERLDGSGYPRGLRGEGIHPWARLVAVADVYDAMTSERPYAAACPPHEAMAELRSLAAAGKLDGRSVRHLTRHLAAYPEGTIVLLESGELAVVVGQTERADAPRVRVLTDARLRLVAPSERPADGSGPGAAIRSVLDAYPLPVRRELAARAAV